MVLGRQLIAVVSKGAQVIFVNVTYAVLADVSLILL